MCLTRMLFNKAEAGNTATIVLFRKNMSLFAAKLARDYCSYLRV